MTNISRPSRRMNDEDSSSSKKKQVGGKSKHCKSPPASTSASPTTFGLRRSPRDINSKTKKPTSPTIRKSERIEKMTQVTPAKRKLEQGEKQRISNSSLSSTKKSLSSGRSEKNRTLSSSNSKKSEKRVSTVKPKNKKQKKENVKPGKLETREESKSQKNGSGLLSKKRKRLDARKYRASFKPLSKNSEQTDVRASCQENDVETATNSPKQVKKVKRGEEHVGKRSRGREKEVDEESLEVTSSASEELNDEILLCDDGEKHSHPSEMGRLHLVAKNHKNEGDFVDADLYSKSMEDQPEDISNVGTPEAASAAISPDATGDSGSPGATSVTFVPEAATDACLDEDYASGENLPHSKSFSSNPTENSVSHDNDLETVDGHRPDERKTNAVDVNSEISGSKRGIFCRGTSHGDANESSICRNKENNSKRCTACSKQLSWASGLEDQDTCSCSARMSHDLRGITLSEDRQQCVRGIENIRTAEGCSSINNPQDSALDAQVEHERNVCVVCKDDGKLLFCDGKGCSRSYHLPCLDPPLDDAPFGTWHCLYCVKKKIDFGVHSVSEGPESIWDVREVERSDCTGMRKEKQYWVKYKGLAHVHNRWISEGQLLEEAPLLITEYSKMQQKEQAVRWKKEWTIPDRLVRRRLLMPPKDLDEHIGRQSVSSSGCVYGWFVKWKGLDYSHGTWELENSPFLTSPETKMLMIDYERWCEKAREASDPSKADKVLQKVKRSSSKLQKLPSEFTAGLDNDNINCISKLREYCYKCENAIIIDEQERIVKVILFILSLQSYICRPFLIISTSSALPSWEDEFSHLASSMNVIVYGGNKNVRKCIRSLEFYEDGGCIRFQILLSSVEAVVEDFEALSSLLWEAVIVDEYQLSVDTRSLENIGMLMSDFRLLLISGQIKDSVAEYRKLLTFLDSKGILENDIDDNACELATMKTKLSHFILYERKPVSLKFVEYWVPVRLSMVQLEQYCATLLENLISLRSSPKTDPVGVFGNILISTRKCCDHPYLVNPSLKVALTKGLPEVKYLDIEVNASGKLKLLDRILPEMKKRGLRVLILFQSIGGTGRNCMGDFLDDYMRQKFGLDSYERIDSGLPTSKKQAALSMFNDKERGRFVFLIENRACHPSIKFCSVDIVIIFDSDWNPLNDSRALQRINFDSPSSQLKVFRLYSSFTVEEKVLVFAKQDVTLDNNVQNINRSTIHMLLMWGASKLFDRLDNFHACDSPCLESNASSEESFLNDVVLELLAQLAHEPESNESGGCSRISKVKHDGGRMYSRNILLLGESELQAMDAEQPHIFWAKLLEGRVPRWRYLTGSSQRSRKKVQYFNESPEKIEATSDEARKKRKKMASIGSLSPKPPVENRRIPATSEKETGFVDSSGASGTGTNFRLQHSPRSPAYVDQKENNLQISPPTESCGRKNLRAEQESLLLFLNPEISKLCGILQLPEAVKLEAGRLLEYIIKNHRVIREPDALFKAFQISLCWTAASSLKHKVNRKESLALVKQQLSFECKEEETEQVYSMLKKLNKKFLLKTGSGKASVSNSKEQRLSSPIGVDVSRHKVTTNSSEAVPSETLVQTGTVCKVSQSSSVDKGVSDCELATSGASGHCGTIFLPSSHNENDSHRLPNNCIKQIEEVCARRTKQILLKQQQEIVEFNKIWEKKKEKLDKARMLAVDRLNAADKDPSAISQKLKTIDKNFAIQLSELSKCMATYQKNLVDMQQDARNAEKQIKARWLEDAKSGRLSESFSELPLSESGFRLDRAGFRLDRAETHERIVQNCSARSILMSGTSSIPNNVNAVVPQVVDSAASGGISNEAPVEITVLGGISAEASIVSQNDVSKDMVLGTRMIPLHSNSINVGISDDNRGDNAALERGEVSDAPHPCQCELTALVSPVICQDHDKSRATSVTQPSRPYYSDDAHQICSQQSQHEKSLSDQPQLSPRSKCSDDASIRVENCDVTSLAASSQQNQDEIPSIEDSSIRPGHDNSAPSHQVSRVNHDQPSMSTAGEEEHLASSEGLSSPHQIQVNQQLYADMSSGNCLLQDPSSAGGTETETRDNGFHPLLQMEIALQQADDNIVQQSERPVSQSAAQSPLSVYINRPTGAMPTGDPQVVGMQLESTGRSSSFPTTLPASRLLFYPEPLVNELARLRREGEEAAKKHKTLINQLTVDCDRDIQEVRRKYNALIGNCDRKFTEMKVKFGAYLTKLSRNLKLAETFRTEFGDPATKLVPRAQGLPASLQHSLRQPLSQTQPRPHHGPVPSVQLAHRMPSFNSSNPTHATTLSPIIPPRFNLQAGAELRAPAPHLQPFRPTSALTPNHLSPANGMLNQQSVSSPITVTSRPSQVPAGPLFVPVGGFGSASLPDNSTPLPALCEPSLSTLELLMDVDHRQSRTSSQSPSDLILPSGILLPSNLFTGTRQDNVADRNGSLVGAADVVYLSDDD